MRTSAATIWIVLAIAYQSLAGPLFVVAGVPQPWDGAPLGVLAPDFVLLVALTLRLLDRSAATLALAAGAGLLVECVSIDPWGSRLLPYALAAWFLSVPAREGWAESGWLRAPCLLAAIAVALLARQGVLWLHDAEMALPSLLTLAARCLYNALLGSCLYPLIAPSAAAFARPRARALRTGGGTT